MGNSIAKAFSGPIGEQDKPPKTHAKKAESSEEAGPV
jgi:hypothetical protein